MTFTDADLVRFLAYIIGSGCAFVSMLFGIGIKILLANERAKQATLLKHLEKQDEQAEKMWAAFNSELGFLKHRVSRVEGALRLPDIQRRTDDLGPV